MMLTLKKQSRQKENQGFGYNKRSVNRRKEKLKPKALPEADLEASNKESQETEKAQSGSHSYIKNHILCEPEPEKKHFQFAKGTEGLYMLVGSDKLFSDKEFPIKNVDQSFIKHIFEEVPVTEAQIRKLVDQKKHVEHNPTKHVNQKNRSGKNQKGPKIYELKPIKSKGTNQMRHSLQNHQ